MRALGVEGFAEGAAGDIGAVGVGTIEESHSQFGSAADHPDGVLAVCGYTSDPGPVSCIVP